MYEKLDMLPVRGSQACSTLLQARKKECGGEHAAAKPRACLGRWLWVGPGAKGLTAGLRARDLVVRRVVDDDLFDGLVDVSLLPLVAANART